MDITSFLNDEYSDSALYMNYRSLPSYIDGLKNSGRKIVYTIKKNHIKGRMKVSALGSEVVKSAGYLHGDASIQGAVVTKAQEYCGANNLPIVKGEGSFGTRLVPEASAPRYIYARPADNFDKIFIPADDGNLISQEFEGDEIEPMFYVPVLPLLFVNGCSGIGVGFASTVLARNPKSIITAIRAYLASKAKNVKIDKKLLAPYWRGFNGTITDCGDNKWEIKGAYTVDPKNDRKITITEVPISFDLLKYRSKLQELKEAGLITKYTDCCEDDLFNFEVILSEEEAKKSKAKIMNDLCLIDSITENLTCVDENNAIKEFSTPEELFTAYMKIKLVYLEKRFKSETKRLSEEELSLREQNKFIKEVVKGTIDLKVKKSVLEAALKVKKYVNIEKLISLPMYWMTEDKAKEIENKWKDKVAEQKAYALETPQSLWEKDLKELEKTL